jgi:hypothetical protein
MKINKNRVIANPPIGIYGNPNTKLINAFYLYLLDTYARFREKFLGEKVFFPGRSYNFFGRIGCGEGTSLNSFIEMRDINMAKVKKDFTREKLNLYSTDLLVDDNDEIIEGITADFLSLYRTGYVFEDSGRYYLDVPKIRSNFNLESVANQIKFSPPRAEVEFRRVMDQNTGEPVRLTRTTRYAPRNPLGGENIGPLFVLANLWDHKYPNSNFSMACTNAVMTRYVLLRCLSRLCLDSSPGMDELFVYPKIMVQDDGVPLDDFLKDGYHSDMLRISLLSSYSEWNQKVHFDPQQIKHGRNIVYLVANLRNQLSLSDYSQEVPRGGYIEDMIRKRYKQVINNITREARDISHQINLLKYNGGWDESSRRLLSRRYSLLADIAEPFMPATIRMIRGEKRNGKKEY